MTNQHSSSKILRQEIIESSKTEETEILERAQKDKELILKEARAKAEKIKFDILKKAEAQAENIQRKILSGVHLETKKQTLRIREEILTKIFQTVKAELEKFRQDKSYFTFLKNLIIEGASALEGETIKIILGDIEKGLLSKAVLLTIEKEIGDKDREVKFSISDQRLQEGGVILMSIDERIKYDNSFSARIKRIEDKMRLVVMKEVFHHSL
jgi:vacuolar-type H+-ATPase subunit E/Vma4